MAQQKYLDMKRQALALASSQRYEDARSLCVQLCGENTDDHEAWFLLGAINGQLGRVEDAINCCRKVVALQPDHVEARFNLAQACRLQGSFDDALDAYRRVLRLDPHHHIARQNLIATLRVQAKHRGSTLLETAGGWIGAGNAARESGNWGEALACYHEALNQQPGDMDALTNLGLAYQDLHKPEESVKYFGRAVEINPRSAEAHFMLANALRDEIRLSQAIAEYDKALEIQPDYVDALHNIGITCMQGGKADDAVDVFRKVLEIDSNRPESHSCLLMNLNYHDRSDLDVFEEHMRWGKIHGAVQGGGESPQCDCDPEKRLKIGYISPDFRAHSVAFFIEPLLARHDKATFEIFCYSDVLCPDIVTRRMQPLADIWRDVRGLSDADLASQVITDHIDILVDLAGHTASNRMGVFARKPAPIQVSYLGYPNTSGLSMIDYRFTDVWADPVGESDALYSEDLFRLLNGFLCYDPHDNTETARPYAGGEGGITFGSFNNLAKVTPEVVTVWAQILSALPDAKLFIKSKPLRDDGVKERLYAQFAAHGITRGKVEAIGWLPGREDHLGAYHKVDIALDTFPYNGTTTTCEALWMGVPVITLNGHNHAGRVGASLLTQTGLNEFIASDVEDYVRIAVKLADNPERLNHLHTRLRAQVASSALCDAATFARNVESAYREIWCKYCA